MISIASLLLAATVTVPAGDGNAIQKAIDDVAAAGGGRVVVPAGEYRAPSLRLKSHVDLHLAKGALLRGGTKSEDYFDFPSEVCSVRPEKSGRVFLYAWDAEDIAITGEGLIDGRAKEFFSRTESEWNFTWLKPACPRPRMVQFVRCRNVRLEGVTFEDSPGWTMLIRQCENVMAEKIFINADHRVINSDGIDIDGCRHVRISKSQINTGDDCIIVRAMREKGHDEPIVCEDVEVSDCKLDSACQCFRFGCPSDDTIRNVRIRNITGSGWNGLNFDYPVGYLSATDEGYMDISDIRVENFSGSFLNCAVRMVVGPGIKLRRVSNITLRDFKVRSIQPLEFIGNADSPLANVILQNFTGDVAGATPYKAVATEPLRLVNCTFNGQKAPDATLVTPRGARQPLVRPKKAGSWEQGSVTEKLPGEDGTMPALGPDPFPDRISAYVWRNWGLVDPTRLAEVVRAKPSDLAAIARDFGLPENPTVLPEWKTRGYITVVRRNWHLLPYGQLTQLLGLTRREFAFRLKEDDFLYHKMGGLKPKCDALVYDADEAARNAPARRRMAARLKANGFDPAADEEPRFAFVKEIAAVQPSTSNLQPPTTSPFDFRLIFSYFADYGDPLADPEIGSFPEGLLQKLAAEGVNAVWLHTVLNTLVKDPKYPEFGAGSANRIANLKKLVARAKKYGIRVYLYMNEPRAQHADFFRKDGREAIAGTPGEGCRSMCTSTPEVRRWLRESLKSVFSQVRGLGGIFTITMSENMTNCASHGHREKCPRCKNRSTAEIVAEVNRTMIEGMLAGDPDAEALVWNWSWPKEDERKILAALPKRGCRVMAVSENDIPVTYGGITVPEADYSIAIVGPGERARNFWGAARKQGLGTVAKVQANCSWELAAFPYVPVMDLVAEHARNLAGEGVTGVMLSWSCGCAPAANLSVYRDFRKGETTIDPVLDRLAAAQYGAEAAPFVRKAWTAFSNGFRAYPFDVVTAYKGPQQWGPANPLYLKPTGYDATMVGIPYDDLHFSKDQGRWDNSWCGRFTPEVFVTQFSKIADGFKLGCALFAEALPHVEAAKRPAAERELAMFRAEQLHFRSSADQARFVLARERGDRAEMARLARRELQAAQALLPLVRADSRIGYECSNHYFYLPRDIGEKMLTCFAAMDLK